MRRTILIGAMLTAALATGVGGQYRKRPAGSKE